MHETHVRADHHTTVLREETNGHIVRVCPSQGFHHLCETCLPEGYELVAHIDEQQSRRAR